MIPLSCNVTVYHSSELKVTVVQMRTPIAKVNEIFITQRPLKVSLYIMQGCGEVFCDALLQWIQNSQFSDVVLLTSSHAHERRDSQIEG